MTAAAAWDEGGHDRRHPPFPRGNDLATTHGAYSPAKVDPIAEAMVENVLSDERASYLRAPIFRHELWRWAQAEARYELLLAHVNGMTLAESTASKAGSTSYDEQLRRWFETAAKSRSRLGMNPISQARLQHDLVDSAATSKLAGLDDTRSKGAAIVAARRQRRQETTDVTDDE